MTAQQMIRHARIITREATLRTSGCRSLSDLVASIFLGVAVSALALIAGIEVGLGRPITAGICAAAIIAIIVLAVARSVLPEE